MTQWKTQFFDFRTFCGENLPNSSCHFRNYKSFCLQVLHQSSVQSNITPLYFLWLKYYILWSKVAHQSSDFWDFQVLGSKFIKFLISILNWQVKSSSNFTSFFNRMTHGSPVNFNLIHFLLWIKGPNERPYF